MGDVQDIRDNATVEQLAKRVNTDCTLTRIVPCTCTCTCVYINVCIRLTQNIFRIQHAYSYITEMLVVAKGTIQRAPRMHVISVYFCLNVHHGPIRLLPDHDFTVRRIQIESIARGHWMVPLKPTVLLFYR